jgi:hypothetical protein
VEIAEGDGGEVQLTERVRAKSGVGKKGRRLRDPKLVQTLVTPAVSLFAAQQRVVFDIQIPKAMQYYEGLHGEKPQSHEEFMQGIVKEGQIQLPELPAGHKYVYDPKQGVLMVERPAR